MNNRKPAQSTTEELFQSFKSTAPYAMTGVGIGNLIASTGEIKRAFGWDGLKGVAKVVGYRSAVSAAATTSVLLTAYGITRYCLWVNRNLNEDSAPSPNPAPALTLSKR